MINARLENDWTINPLADITNQTNSPMYVTYYVAFFNQDGRIVGCCNQSICIKPLERPMQLGSSIRKAM